MTCINQRQPADDRPNADVSLAAMMCFSRLYLTLIDTDRLSPEIGACPPPQMVNAIYLVYPASSVIRCQASACEKREHPTPWCVCTEHEAI